MARYYLKGEDAALQRCGGDGCSADLKTTAELESKHLHMINDGIIASRDWHTTRPKVLQTRY